LSYARNCRCISYHLAALLGKMPRGQKVAFLRMSRSRRSLRALPARRDAAPFDVLSRLNCRGYCRGYCLTAPRGPVHGPETRPKNSAAQQRGPKKLTLALAARIMAFRRLAIRRGGLPAGRFAAAPCARSSMDRASVFGTDARISEVANPQGLANGGTSARSAGRSADSKNTPAGSPADCPQREPGTWCIVRAAAGLVAAGLATGGKQPRP